MKLSAIREDNTVTVDGMTRIVQWSAVMPEGWYAVQWDAGNGHIEYDGPRRNEAVDAGLITLIKSAWDAGTGIGLDQVGAAATDTIAQARAAVLDKLVLEAAKAADASEILVSAAAAITVLADAKI